MIYGLLAVILLIAGRPVSAQDNYIAIIIDDLGDNLPRGFEAIELPEQITYSFLPHSRYSRLLAAQAHLKGKEIMLHMPMQPESDKDMGPGGLNSTMNQLQFLRAVRNNIEAIPYIAGINNHMGSLLTRQPLVMRWLMQEIKIRKNLYFVDSKTHEESIAERVAMENRIPHASRDVFLDHEIDRKSIDNQFQQLIEKAIRNGAALAIGHPHRATLDALAEWIPEINRRGIKVVPVSEYIEIVEGQRNTWQASLSFSHKVAKN